MRFRGQPRGHFARCAGKGDARHLAHSAATNSVGFPRAPRRSPELSGFLVVADGFPTMPRPNGSSRPWARAAACRRRWQRRSSARSSAWSPTASACCGSFMSCRDGADAKARISPECKRGAAGNGVPSLALRRNAASVSPRSAPKQVVTAERSEESGSSGDRGQIFAAQNDGSRRSSGNVVTAERSEESGSNDARPDSSLCSA